MWWCELPDIGRRPVVVLSRNAAIPRLRRTVVAPCTTTVRGLASEVVLERGEDPVPRRCSVNLDSLESVSVAVLTERLGRLSDERMLQVCAALDVASNVAAREAGALGPEDGSQLCACSCSTDGATIGPSGGWVKRIAFPKGSRSAQSVP